MHSSSVWLMESLRKGGFQFFPFAGFLFFFSFPYRGIFLNFFLLGFILGFVFFVWFEIIRRTCLVAEKIIEEKRRENIISLISSFWSLLFKISIYV